VLLDGEDTATPGDIVRGGGEGLGIKRARMDNELELSATGAVSLVG
jgi:hypothetical protein